MLPAFHFFKINEEYAHGGISIHECLVPELIIENPNVDEYRCRIETL
jgi:hypothetical protein